jgi:hypothetical protein
MGRFHYHADGTGHTHDDADHDHEHDRLHDDHGVGDHSGYQTGSLRVDVLEKILGENDRTAEANRTDFHAADVRVVNLMSSPGAGKTTLLREVLLKLGTSIVLPAWERPSRSSTLPTGSAGSATSTQRWCDQRYLDFRWTTSIWS